MIKVYLFHSPNTSSRARSRYALRVFSFTRCTARVLTGIFFVYGRQRDAGLNSFWVQRYFYLSNTLSGIRVCLRRPPQSGRRRLDCFVQALYKPSPLSFGTLHVGIAAGFVQGLRGEVVGGRLYANRSKSARGKEAFRVSDRKTADSFALMPLCDEQHRKVGRVRMQQPVELHIRRRHRPFADEKMRFVRIAAGEQFPPFRKRYAAGVQRRSVLRIQAEYKAGFVSSCGNCAPAAMRTKRIFSSAKGR